MVGRTLRCVEEVGSAREMRTGNESEPEQATEARDAKVTPPQAERQGASSPEYRPGLERHPDHARERAARRSSP